MTNKFGTNILIPDVQFDKSKPHTTHIHKLPFLSRPTTTQIILPTLLNINHQHRPPPKTIYPSR